MKKTKKTKIVDVFKGEILSVWKDDEDDYTLATPFATLDFDRDMWEAFKRDVDKLSEL